MKLPETLLFSICHPQCVASVLKVKAAGVPAITSIFQASGRGKANLVPFKEPSWKSHTILN